MRRLSALAATLICCGASQIAASGELEWSVDAELASAYVWRGQVINTEAVLQPALNLSYGGNCAPEKDAAEFTAARYAKSGVNAVRLHKFSYPTNHMGIADPVDSTRMTPEGLERLDYFSAQLKERGIYYAWSHTFGFRVTPGQRDRLRAYDEIADKLGGKTYALINLAEDVQDLMIEMVVRLLRHKNPHIT